MGGLINFQTQAPEGMGCIWPETITQGLILGARAIELWPEKKYQGFTTLTVPGSAGITDSLLCAGSHLDAGAKSAAHAVQRLTTSA